MTMFRPTVSQKLHIIDVASDPNRSLKSVARQFGVQPSQIRDWRRKVNQLTLAKRSKKGLQPGRPSKLLHLQEQLLRWVDEQRKLDIGINYTQVAVKAATLDETFRLLPPERQYEIVRRMCRANGIVVRRRTYLAQQRPDETVQLAYNWMFYMRPLCLPVHRKFIINMDETPCPFNLPPTTTLARRNSPSVIIRRTGSGTVRATVALSVCSDGTKIRPMIIFKGRPNGRIQRNELGHHPASCCVHLTVQDNAWMDNDKMQEWIEYCLVPHIQQRAPNSTVILILDSFSAHESVRTTTRLNELGVSLHLIPGGITPHVQPCDVGVNKPFKDRLRRKWSDFLLGQGADRLSFVNPSREDVSTWVDEVWNDLPEQIVRNSWKNTYFEYFDEDEEE